MIDSGIRIAIVASMTPKVFIRYPENGLYYCRVSVRGRRHLFCTKTDDAKIARQRARDYRDALTAEAYGLAKGMKANTPCPTFEQLHEVYLTLPVPANMESRRQNWASLKNVLAASHLSPKDRVDRLSRQTALNWQMARLGRGMASNALESGPLPQGSATPGSVVSCNTRMRQAKAMFSKRALAFYPESMCLPMERIRDFLSVPAMPQVTTIRALPTDAAMAAAENRTTGLPQHKPEWCAYLLAKYAGMRPKEIVAARWSWLKDGVITVGGQDGAAGTKTGRFRSLRLAPDVASELMVNATDPVFIAGSFPMRTVRGRLVIMLRAYGFTMDDPTYSLRRWHASWRYQNQGAPSARDSMGHTTESTTMRHYARMIAAPEGIPMTNNVDSLAIHIQSA